MTEPLTDTAAANELTPQPSLSTGVLARNTLYALGGLALPLAVALVATPFLIRGLGAERYALLNIIWVVVGYASLFDFGLSRALTKLVAETLGRHDTQRISPLVWTAMVLMFAFGLVGALLIAAFAPWLVHSLLKTPELLQAETTQAFYVMAFSIPFVVSTAALRGVIEATLRFDLTSSLRTALGIFIIVSPLLVAPFTPSLVWVVIVLLLGRVLFWLFHLYACLRVLPILRTQLRLDRAFVRPLLAFGGWITLTNIVSPLMVTIDRVLIGAVISIAAVAYYVTPFDLITRLLVLSSALTTVLFPAFSSSLVHYPARARVLYERAVHLVLLTMALAAFVVIIFAHDLLLVWVGPTFAQQSTRVLQILAVGVVMNGVALLPYTYIQSAGRPDITAKLHLAELAFYLLMLWLLTSRFGIVGAALTWTLRVGLDMLLLYIISSRLWHQSNRTFTRSSILTVLLLIGAGLAASATTLVSRTAWAGIGLFAFTAASWWLVLDAADRASLWQRLAPLVRKGSIVP